MFQIKTKPFKHNLVIPLQRAYLFSSEIGNTLLRRVYIQYIFSIYIYRGVKLDLSMSPLQCKQVFQSILIKLLLHCILFHAIEKSVRVRSDQYMA